jgi:hypothetical protein
MLVDIVVIVLSSAILFAALRATWRLKSAFWFVVIAAIIGNVALLTTRQASQLSDLLTLWSVFFIGPLVFTVPWLRVAAVAHRRLLLGTLAVFTYLGASVAWVTLAFNTGALTP